MKVSYLKVHLQGAVSVIRYFHIKAYVIFVVKVWIFLAVPHLAHAVLFESMFGIAAINLIQLFWGFIIISLGISGEQAAVRTPSNTGLTFSLKYISCISVVLGIAVVSCTAHIRRIVAVLYLGQTHMHTSPNSIICFYFHGRIPLVCTQKENSNQHNRLPHRCL